MNSPKKMGTSSQLATIDEMENLWFELQREMTESGKISKFQGTFTKLSGDKVEYRNRSRGLLCLDWRQGQYLQWDSDSQSIVRAGAATDGTSRIDRSKTFRHAAPRRSG